MLDVAYSEINELWSLSSGSSQSSRAGGTENQQVVSELNSGLNILIEVGPRCSGGLEEGNRHETGQGWETVGGKGKPREESGHCGIGLFCV